MIDGLKERLVQFLDDKTYTYIRDSFEYNFNGYIIEVHENSFLFLDDVLGKIKIQFGIVIKIGYSNKGKGE